jgi:membrane protease YdiL (CAAX protease family)
MIVFKNSAAGFLGFQFLFFLSAFLIAQWQGGKGFSLWGLSVNKGFLLYLLSGMWMGILFYGSIFFIAILLGSEKAGPMPSFAAIGGPLLLFVFGNFFSSFSEDILTRAYVNYHFGNRMKPLLLVIFSALIYLLNHIYKLDKGPATWIYLFALGILYIIPLIVTKKLWFTGGMHWAGNSFFFFTHELIGVQEAKGVLSFNGILVLVALVFMPLVYVVSKFLYSKLSE